MKKKNEYAPPGEREKVWVRVIVGYIMTNLCIVNIIIVEKTRHDQYVCS